MTFRRWRHVGLGLGLVCGCHPTNQTEANAPTQHVQSTAQPAPSVSKPIDAPLQNGKRSSSTNPPIMQLPGASRVFSQDLDGDGQDEVLGAHTGEIWAYKVVPAGFQKLWSLKGQGTVHQVAFGTLGANGDTSSPSLYLAWGVARGALKAPLAVDRVVPLTGKRIRLWEHDGPRNEPAYLAIEDTDGDDSLDLAFAYYASKYMVKPYHFSADGGVKPGKAVRMASARAYGRAFSPTLHAEVIGRVYGDARGLSGDLNLNTASGQRKIPTEDGVRSVLIARVGDDTVPHIYFADGWVADYGKSAKAQLKRVAKLEPEVVVETVGRSDEEFTFFNLRAIDLNGDGRQELLARGNKWMHVFQMIDGNWRRFKVAQLPPVLNAAIMIGKKRQPSVVIPNEKSVILRPISMAWSTP
ncbi:MAG: hypothetical protein VX589_17805 [Myxococcota bacterium]|nr:hypothetical protein [Myxococcota bacterium]